MTDTISQDNNDKNQYSSQVNEFTKKFVNILFKQVQHDINTGKLKLNKSSKKELA